MAQGYVVSQLAVVASCIHSVMEFGPRLLELALLVENAPLIHHNIRVLLVALPQQRFRMLDFILLISNQGLQEDYFVLVGGILDALRHF